MKVFVRTWRYGVEATILYHGREVSYDPHNAVLHIVDPELEDEWGMRTVVTIVSGDEFTVARCVTCEVHKETGQEIPQVKILE